MYHLNLKPESRKLIFDFAIDCPKIPYLPPPDDSSVV